MQQFIYIIEHTEIHIIEHTENHIIHTQKIIYNTKKKII